MDFDGWYITNEYITRWPNSVIHLISTMYFTLTGSIVISVSTHHYAVMVKCVAFGEIARRSVSICRKNLANETSKIVRLDRHIEGETQRVFDTRNCAIFQLVDHERG